VGALVCGIRDEAPPLCFTLLSFQNLDKKEYKKSKRISKSACTRKKQKVMLCNAHDSK
jgi:hypothetical protein